MILNRYLTREVLQSLGAVVIVLMLAFLSQQIVRYLHSAAMGKIPTRVLLELVSFEIPYLLALLLPLAAYLGFILAYGRLCNDQEMLIMQMAGFDLRKLIRLTLMIATGVALMVWLLMFFVNPAISAKRQQVMESGEATLHLIETLIPGRFQESSDGQHVMYVEKISVDHQKAKNVFIAELKKSPTDTTEDDWSIVSANQGYQEKDPESGNDFFVTEKGYRYEGVPGQNDFKVTQYERYGVRMSHAETTGIHKDVESLSSWQLIGGYLKPALSAEMQWRISMGLCVLLLALIAMPLSLLKPRQGRFTVLFPAVLIYVIYVNLLYLARRLIEQGTVSIWVGMWWVHLLILVLFFVIYHVKTRQWKMT